jgi:DNA topoisomerase-1
VPEKPCPDCGKPLVARRGKRGVFLGCSGYPKCRHTESLPAEGEAGPAAEGGPSGDKKPSGESQGAAPQTDKKCPNCGKPLVIKQSRRGPFLACPGYPECKHAEPISGVKAKKEPPKTIGRQCPDCGKDLVLRAGRRGTFVGCSGYPKCKHTEDAGA